MIDTLLMPFSYNYMFNAMWVSALVGGVCAFLSAYLMLKGWSLIGDALSHSIVPGVAGAYMLGLPFAFGAFAAGGLAAGAMLFLNQRSGLKEDAIIGLIFTSFFGLGLFMVSLSPMSVSIQTITMGNILAITPHDTLQLAINFRTGATYCGVTTCTKWGPSDYICNEEATVIVVSTIIAFATCSFPSSSCNFHTYKYKYRIKANSEGSCCHWQTRRWKILRSEIEQEKTTWFEKRKR